MEFRKKRIQEEINHLDKKIDDLERKLDLDEVNVLDANEDLANWRGWRTALSWVLNECQTNPHEGDGY